MPVTDAFILATIIFAFIAFGAVLAWGEYQTRHVRKSDLQSPENAEQKYGPTRTIRAKTAQNKELNIA